MFFGPWGAGPGEDAGPGVKSVYDTILLVNGCGLLRSLVLSKKAPFIVGEIAGTSGYCFDWASFSATISVDQLRPMAIELAY